MTPKEKAKELVNKFYFKLSNNGSLDIGINNCTQRFNEAKDCALIAVDEILQNGSLINQSELYKANKINPTPIYREYWQLVKKEIKKL